MKKGAEATRLKQPYGAVRTLAGSDSAEIDPLTTAPWNFERFEKYYNSIRCLLCPN